MKLHWLRNGSMALVAVGLSVSSFSGQAASTIQAKYETKAYLETDHDSDADDPAIWVHPSNKSKSLVIGTLKNGGLAVFNLQGQEVQRILAPAAPPLQSGQTSEENEPGRFNNVDLLLGFSLSGTSTDLAVVSDRGRDKLVIYKINPGWSATVPPLTDVTASNAPFVFNSTQDQVNNQNTAYGLATQKIGSSSIGFVNQRERAAIRKVTFTAATGGKVTYSLGSIYTFPSTFTVNGQQWTPCQDEDGVQAQFEGMVIDKDAQRLYAGQEMIGIWRMDLNGGGRVLLEKTKTYGSAYTRTFDPEEEEYACEYTTNPGTGGKYLAADVEGLTIYYSPVDSAERLLFASSQGDNTFHVWDIDSTDNNQWEYSGSFQVVFNGDLNEESDGSHIVSAAFDSGDYSMGLFVSQDGHNTPDVLDADGEAIDNANFKFTPAKRIVQALDLDID